jgi:hypothetical protein
MREQGIQFGQDLIQPGPTRPRTNPDTTHRDEGDLRRRAVGDVIGAAPRGGLRRERRVVAENGALQQRADGREVGVAGELLAAGVFGGEVTVL